MTVGSHSERSWPCVALLYHDLMADASSGRIEDDILLLCKLLDLAVLLQVLLRLVLHIVVESHDDLLWVVDLGGSNAHELESDGP